MNRLQSIENALASINETVFQELCDSFLILKNENYRTFARPGSQSGKQKTIKGTPDTFLLLPNGKYIFVEYSTNITKGISKLQDDIKKCVDTTKTGISANQITEIIICVNFKLNPIEIKSLQDLLSKTQIILTVYTLDSLALDLNLQYRHLVRDYLNLPFDTGQIVSIETFVTEYASKGIATPLNNTFLHRATELEEIKNLINQNDFVILTGAAGVGKTKIAIEAIKSFLSENSTYNAYCISYKDCDLIDDLYQYFNQNKDYIIFVDDANRIDRIGQIVGFYQSERKGKLKIILTCRDYALKQIEMPCFEFTPAKFPLSKLTDEQITDIIKAEPFEILNSEYHKGIIHIADGNPRLAIMAALLAKKEQNLHVLADVSELFERYFTTFVKDNGEFSNQLNIKCLGIIAFFFSVPLEKDTLAPILENFGLNYGNFIDSINRLDNLELVEIRYNYVKIPEQNLSTFFFYKAFVKDNLLSFETLLQKYFDNNNVRFTDCVIPAVNMFGYQNVKKLQPALKNYLKSIANDEKRVFKFLSIFWFYLQDETLELIFNITEKMPAKNVSSYEVKYENNAFNYGKNEVIELVANFFIPDRKLKTAIELIFEYVRKMPEYLPELIHKIRETLIFEHTDEYNNFYRQTTFFQVLIDGLNKKDILYSTAFYELAKIFLAFDFHYIRGGRNHSITSYQYPLPYNQIIREFRKNIWNNLDVHFSEYFDASFKLLQQYGKGGFQHSKELIEYDLQFLIPLIEKYLTPNSFEHCKYVQEQIRWCKRVDVVNSNFDILSKKFTNPLYEKYLKLDWDYFRNKKSFEFDNHDEFVRLKEEEIRNAFIFNNIDEIKVFYHDYLLLKQAGVSEWGWQSIDFVIDENCTKNFELGCQLFLEVIENNNEVGYMPFVFFRNQLKTKEKAETIWNILQRYDFKGNAQWKMSFYHLLDDALIEKEIVNHIKNTIREVPDKSTIWFRELQRYLTFEPNLFQDLLEIIVERNETESIDINFFEHYTEQINNIELLKKAYLQQCATNNHSDLVKKGFLEVLKRDANFLIDYVNALYSKNSDRYSLHEEYSLNVVWNIENIEPILIKTLDLISEKEIYLGIGEHFANSFFQNLPSENKEQAKNLLLNYCKENFNDSIKINMIVDIARHSMREIFSDILLLFISLTQDKEYFSAIHWSSNGGTYSGDVIIGDIEATEWRNILSIVEQSQVGIKLIPIKNHIKEKIESSLQYAKWERKRKFIEKD